MARIFKRGDQWWLDYSDHRGDRVRRPGSTDKVVAQHLLGRAIQSTEKVRAGVVQADPREGKRPIDQHLDDYAAELARRGRDEMYAYTVRKRLDRMVERGGWSVLPDATPKSIASILTGLNADKLSPKTVNDYRADLSAFFGWCVRVGRMEGNPCVAVERTEAPKVKTRRALSARECRALIEKAGHPRRRLIYLFLVYTGARRAEAGQLVWGDLHLDGLNARVDFPGSITKSGQAESVPLVPVLADALPKPEGTLLMMLGSSRACRRCRRFATIWRGSGSTRKTSGSGRWCCTLCGTVWRRCSRRAKSRWPWRSGSCGTGTSGSRARHTAMKPYCR